ncbi:hypothetical protein ASD08_47755 [Streptomyces sp. Root369]|nr:hypothetical protein ASD08_47755 [Streptomyces sp. Root369]
MRAWGLLSHFLHLDGAWVDGFAGGAFAVQATEEAVAVVREEEEDAPFIQAAVGVGFGLVVEEGVADHAAVARVGGFGRRDGTRQTLDE